MIEKFVIAYRKLEMSLINSISSADSDIYNETAFLDEGFIQSRISRIKKELDSISKEIKISLDIKDDSNYGKTHRSDLLDKRERLIFEMLFLASNSFLKLDECIKLAEGHTFAFVKCIKALLKYKEGDFEQAYNILDEYYTEHRGIPGHFLANKVYGLILVKRRDYEKAIPVLTEALQLIPDDMECLNELQKCFNMSGQNDKGERIGEVISLLT